MKPISHTFNPIYRVDPKDITSNSRRKKKSAARHNDKYDKSNRVELKK